MGKKKKKEDFIDEEEYLDDEYEESDDSERLSVYEAALIWMCRGFDEDDMFGYTAEELKVSLRD